MVITTTQLHSTKPELRFSADSNPARGVSEIRYGEDLWHWSQLETRVNGFRRSTIPQKQFFIIIIIIIIINVMRPPHQARNFVYNFQIRFDARTSKFFDILTSNPFRLCICAIVFLNTNKQTQTYIKRFAKKIKNKNGIRLGKCHVSLLKEGFHALCHFYDCIRCVSTI